MIQGCLLEAVSFESCNHIDGLIVVVRLPSAPPSRATTALVSIIRCLSKGAFTASVQFLPEEGFEKLAFARVRLFSSEHCRILLESLI